jgi:uncharacterized protein (TIRG00374 family)
VPALVVLVAYRDRAVLSDAIGVLCRARLEWLVPGILAITGVYVCRALVYGAPLQLLGHASPRGFLWRIALMSTSLHQLIPVGGASGYAFLTYALHRRGVPAGEASVVALVDTLSNAAAVATLVVVTLVYLLLNGLMAAGPMASTLVPGVVVLAVAAIVYHLQRDRSRLTRVVIGAERWVASCLGARWREDLVHEFLADFFEAKAIIAENPAVFLRMLGLQYCAVGCDVAALSTAFLALGNLPAPGIVLMGFIVAMTGGAVTAAPGGGGSFELVMTSFFALHGVRPARALAATILYRCLAFWLPIGVTVVLLLRLRQRRPAHPLV